MTSSSPDSEYTNDASPLPEAWYRNHFNHFAPELEQHLIPTLKEMRAKCPVTHSDALGGFWIATRYKDIQRIALDWKTFSSGRGVVVPKMPSVQVPALPEQMDPPLHRIFKDLINKHLTSDAVAAHEDATRDLINQLIDGFIEQGHCDFMADFAVPMPGIVLFDKYLNAPRDELTELSQLACAGSIPTTEEGMQARVKILEWASKFIDARRRHPGYGDIVDAVINADIDGRPITDTEILGVIQLIIFGGLDTTAGALGHMMLRFCRQPEIPALLRRQPELIPAAVEELLRLDSPFVFIARTVAADTELNGKQLREDEMVLISWQSANRDEEVFPNAQEFDLHRADKRHMAFGTGPHRCSGSNLALLNLRLALEQIVDRMEDIILAEDVESIAYHCGFNRSPRYVPIRFKAGRRLGV